jgi:hypothetical protein
VTPVRQSDLAQRASPVTTATIGTTLVATTTAAAVDQEPEQPDEPWRDTGVFLTRHRQPLMETPCAALVSLINDEPVEH